MKRLPELISLILVLIVFSTNSIAQQRPINTLYMYDHLLINPAYAGAAVQLSATAVHRNQWVNFPGSPVTTSFTIHSGFLKSKIGIGLMVNVDKIGIHDDVGFYMAYSYKIVTEVGTLSMGLQAGFNNLKSDFSSLNLRSNADPNLAGARSKFNPNFGAGLYFNSDKLYAGLSSPYLINNKIVDFEGVVSEAKQRRNYYLHGGLRLDVTPVFRVLPSLLMRAQEGAPLSFDITTVGLLYETVGLGVSYRLNDSFGWLFELQVNENFHLGYAYDKTTSALRQYSSGTHELMINYRIRIPKLHKGLECPSYF
jgi:type IX secretion system PorP/SprF family membrane protein